MLLSEGCCTRLAGTPGGRAGLPGYIYIWLRNAGLSAYFSVSCKDGWIFHLNAYSCLKIVKDSNSVISSHTL